MLLWLCINLVSNIACVYICYQPGTSATWRCFWALLAPTTYHSPSQFKVFVVMQFICLAISLSLNKCWSRILILYFCWSLGTVRIESYWYICSYMVMLPKSIILVTTPMLILFWGCNIMPTSKVIRITQQYNQGRWDLRILPLSNRVHSNHYTPNDSWCIHSLSKPYPFDSRLRCSWLWPLL